MDLSLPEKAFDLRAANDLKKKSARVAICVHAFYPEIFSDISSLLKRAPNYCDIYITCTVENEDAVRVIAKKHELEAEFLIVENVGMDVIPFLRAIEHFGLNAYLAIIKLHTKNNKTQATETLGRHMITRLIGTPDVVNSVYNAFLSDCDVFLAGPNDTFKYCHYMMYNNRTVYGKLCNLFGIPANSHTGFFAGTMFWIRGSLLSFSNGLVDELAALATDGGLELTKTGRDGSVAHALERIWGALAPSSDAKIAVIYRRDFDDVASVVRVERQAILLTEPLRRLGVTEHILRHKIGPKDGHVIGSSALFDSVYYADRCGDDLLNPGMDPALHYALYGDLFGRNPSKAFNTIFYHLNRRDVLDKNVNVLVHYIQHGQREGEIIAPTHANWISLAKKMGLFDDNFYEERHPFSNSMFGDATRHYLMIGMYLGYQPSPNFNVNSDLGIRPLSQRSLPAYLENSYDDEHRKYSEIIRTVQNNDFELLDTLVDSLENAYGETGVTLVCRALSCIQYARWGDLLEKLDRYWNLLQDRQLPLRHFRYVANEVRQYSSGAIPLDMDLREPTRHEGRFCVYTCLFGDIDRLPPVVAHRDDIDFICFTDQNITVPGWDIQEVAPEIGDPNLDAKIYKILPHRFLANYEGSLFVDANTFIHGRLNHLIRTYLAPRNFVMWNHPDRSDVYVEAIAIVESARHSPEILVRQIQNYHELGLPRHSGLFEASFIWRRHDAPSINSLMESWWAEICQWSKRDQLSLGYLTWKTGVRPEVLPSEVGTARSNQFFTKLPHLRLPHEITSKPSHTPSTPLRLRDRIWILYGSKFVNTGSTILRGYQLSEILKSVLTEHAEIYYSSVDNARDGVVWVTKSYLAQHGVAGLQRLKANKNIVLLDNVDGRLPPTSEEYVDALIASSLEGFRQYRIKFPRIESFHVTHHVDTRIPNVAPPTTDQILIGYFGEIINTRRTPKIERMVDFLGVDTSAADTAWIDCLADYNCHYLIRNQRLIDGHKPFLKGFVAAHCGAPVIAERDTGDANFYLGTDYPYLLPMNAAEKSIEKMIQHVSDSIGSPEWTRACDVMAEIKARSNLETVKREMDYVFRQFLSERCMRVSRERNACHSV